jgi:hypothetical protein
MATKLLLGDFVFSNKLLQAVLDAIAMPTVASGQLLSSIRVLLRMLKTALGRYSHVRLHHCAGVNFTENGKRTGDEYGVSPVTVNPPPTDR